MAVLLLIRHAENDFVGKRLAGRLPDVHLNAAGLHQAETITAALRHESIVAIFSSPMERALETAAPLARDLYLPITCRPGLTEVDFGSWQGKSISRLKKLKLWQSVQNKPTSVRFPDGESFEEAQQRIVLTLKEINAAYGENDRVACFSHGDTISLAVAYFLDMPLDSFQRLVIQTASITRLHLNQTMTMLLQLSHPALPLDE